MKKIYLIPLMGLLLGACSNDDMLQSPDNSPNDVANASGYLTINLASTGAFGSRADDSYVQGPGTYVDGSPAENKVNKVRFYFFNDGAPCLVRKNPVGGTNEYFSFIDWVPANANNQEGGADHNDATVEKTLTTTLVFSKPASGDDPNQVVAVINPPSSIEQMNDNLPLEGASGLRAQIGNYLLDGTTVLNNNNFIMTNSVFATGSPLKTQYAQPITDAQVGKTYSDALANPVTIFVERVAARVDFAFDGSESSNLVKKDLANGGYAFDVSATFAPKNVQDLNSDLTPQAPQQVYFKPEAWALASFTTRSNLIKEINPSWASDLFGVAGNPWNADIYFRSFWGINPSITPDTYNWYSFTQITGNNANGQPAANVTKVGNAIDGKPIYTLENANPDATDAQNYFNSLTSEVEGGTAPTFNVNDGMNPLSPTKVIFVGRLVDGAGNPLTICEFRGMQFTEAGLMEYVASLLNIYSSTDNGTTGTRITASDLKLVTQSEWLNSAPNKNIDGRYYSYFELSDQGKGKTWYYQTTPGNYQAIPEGKINQYIDDDLGNSHAKVWMNGMTYYYYDIRHLGVAGSVGSIGIVRNHIYDTTVTKITGLGTPVLNPEEVIYPEKPESDKNNIATVIKILSWRLVSTSYDVEWP